MEKENPFALLVGMYIGAVTLKNCMAFPKAKKYNYCMISNSTLDIYPKKRKNINSKKIYTPMLRAALFTITKIGKKPDLLVIDEHQNRALIV